MLATLSVVLPIFALIFAGWLVRRLGVLGPAATSELNRFVVYLALPALLFDITAHASWTDIWQPGFIAAFGVSAVLAFGVAFAAALMRHGRVKDASIDGLNAAYPNVGYVGFPLAALSLGRAALAPTLIATIITVCVVFAFAIVLIESALQADGHPLDVARKVLRSLARNPLLVAPVLGALVPLTGSVLPAPAETFLKLLGGAASPCALVALGLFLASERPAGRRAYGVVGFLVIMKLLVQPLVAWGIATALHLPPLLVHAAALIAALPTGTGPFMLAEFYKREADLTADVILVSTVLSVVTLTAYLAFAV
jgi:malonate transporter